MTIAVSCSGCGITIHGPESDTVRCPCGNAAIHPNGDVSNVHATIDVSVSPPT